MRPIAVTVVAAAVAVAVASIAGCQPAATELTDPREILGRTVAASAALRTVAIRAELQIRNPGDVGPGPGGAQGGTLEGHVDLAASAASFRLAEFDRQAVGAVTTSGGVTWVQSSGSPRWQQLQGNLASMPLAMFMGAAPGGPGPDYPRILAELAADPGIDVQLLGVEECATGRCYHVSVTIPPAELWPLVTKLLGLDRFPGFTPEPPDAAALPPISIDLLSDTGSLRLVTATIGGQAQGTSVLLRVELPEVNGPVSIQPPPPELVDVANPGFGVGGGEAPAATAILVPAASADPRSPSTAP